MATQSILRRAPNALKSLWRYHISFVMFTLREKCPYSEFSWSTFSPIRTEYGKIWSISPHSVQMRENTGQKNSEYWNFYALLVSGPSFMITFFSVKDLWEVCIWKIWLDIRKWKLVHIFTKILSLISVTSFKTWVTCFEDAISAFKKLLLGA